MDYQALADATLEVRTYNLRQKYWQDQWLINELEELRHACNEFFPNGGEL